MIQLIDYIKKKKIFFINTKDKTETLEFMINNLRDLKEIKNFDEFKKAVFKRESIISTGIGKNVAIPHVKIKSIDSFFISIAIHKTGVEWNSLDGQPVHFIFLIGGPENHTLYLRILAKLTLIIKNDEIRNKLKLANSEEEVLKIFKEL